MIEDGVLTMLLNANRNLAEDVEALQTRVEELEDALEEERELRKRSEQEAQGAPELVRAVRDYLAWKERPPLQMSPPVYAGIERSLRAVLENALKSFEG